MVQRKMFLPPKEMLEKWSALVKNNKRPLSKTDRVCERHFDSDDIIEFWESKINGRIHLTPRDKPKLRDTAIPTKNLASIDPKSVTDNAPTQKRKIAPREQQQESIRENKLMKLICDETNDIIEQLDVDIPEDAESLFSQATTETPIILQNPETTNKLHELYQSSIQSNDHLTEEEREKSLAIFETLYDEAFDVELPSLLWGIHRDPERKFIAFTEFNQQLMNVSKTVIVYDTLSTDLKVNGITKVQDCLTRNSESSVTEEMGTILDGFDKNY